MVLFALQVLMTPHAAALKQFHHFSNQFRFGTVRVQFFSSLELLPHSLKQASSVAYSLLLQILSLL